MIEHEESSAINVGWGQGYEDAAETWHPVADPAPSLGTLNGEGFF
jgi:hypothetical protein